MPTVYKVLSASERFQDFTVDEASANYDAVSWLHQRPLHREWIPPKVYFHMAKKTEGDFVIYANSFAVRAALWTSDGFLSNFLEQSGEVLPFEYMNTDYFVFNCLTCLNALDLDRSTFFDNDRQMVDSYKFLKNRFAVSLFTIPEAGGLLCVEWQGDPEDEFKGHIEAKGYTGLSFHKIWSSADD